MKVTLAYVRLGQSEWRSALAAATVLRFFSRSQVLCVIPWYSVLFHGCTPCYLMVVLRAIPWLYSVLFHGCSPCYSMVVLRAIPWLYSVLFHGSTPCYSMVVLRAIPWLFSVLFHILTLNCAPSVVTPPLVLRAHSPLVLRALVLRAHPWYSVLTHGTPCLPMVLRAHPWYSVLFHGTPCSPLWVLRAHLWP